MRKSVFITLIFPFFLALYHISVPFPVRAAQTPSAAKTVSGRPTIGETFDGERTTYDIGIWLFSKVAVGELSFEKEDGGYRVTLVAYTTGFVDRVLQHRRDVYTSHLKEVDGGKRLITLSFEKRVDINGKVRRGVTEVDYKRHIIKWRSWGGGKDARSGEDPFPEGIYCDDPLAAFYNFRYGVYGPAEEGRSYMIYTFPKKKKVSEIALRIITRREFEERTAPYPPPSYFLADAKLDREVFGSGSGRVEIYFTKKLLPLKAVAKDIAFFGDVRGLLRGYNFGAGRGDASVEVKGAIDSTGGAGR